MIKLLIIFLLIFIICSTDKSKNIVKTQEKNYIKKEINKEEIITKIFNNDLEINFKNNPDFNSLGEFKNNFGRQNIKNIAYNISNYSLKKIKNFSKFDPNLIFVEDGIIFFEKKGSIIKYNFKKKNNLEKKLIIKKRKKIISFDEFW